MTKVIVFDVCWTLFRSNTTNDFILFYLKRKNFCRYLVFRFLTFRPVGIILNLVGIKDFRERIIRQLEGSDLDELVEIADLFYLQFLVKKKNDVVFEEFLRTKNDGETIFLASASLDIVVSTIAKFNNVNYVSSKLKYNKNVCEGVLIIDATGCKHELLKEKTGRSFYDAIYSDNIEDIQMQEFFEKYFYVKNTKIFKFSSLVEIKNNE